MTAEVGLEVTRVFARPGTGPLPEQALASARQRVLQRTEERLAALDIPFLTVAVHFAGHWTPRGTDVESVAERLAHLAREHAPPEGGVTRLRDGDERLSHLWDVVVSVTIQRLVPSRKHILWAPTFAYMERLLPEQLRVTIRAKERRIDYYHKGLTELWQVLYFGSFNTASPFEVDVSSLPRNESAFSHVILFDSSRGSVWRLESAKKPDAV